MNDLGLFPGEDGYDLQVDKSDLKLDEGLRTAILLSLFTDQRVSLEELSDAESDRRGWWGDLFPEIPGDQMGSKLWLLKREKLVPEILARAQEYASDALQWMVDDGVVDSVIVTASAQDGKRIQLEITLKRPKGPEVFRFSMNWSAELARGD